MAGMEVSNGSSTNIQITKIEQSTKSLDFSKTIMSKSLTSLSTLNFEDILFSKPEINNIPGQKLSYQRIRINISKNGELSDLIIPSPPSLLSWGLQESRDLATQNLNGYQVPVVLWSNGNPSTEEVEFTDRFKDLCEYIKTYLVENKASFDKYDLELSELKKFNPLYWKMEKGKIVEDKGPTLYAKCLYDRRKDKINTVFTNEETKEIVNPQSIIGKRCYVSFALKIEGIFIGNKISLQVKLHEVMFRLQETGMKSLLCPEATFSNTYAENEVESSSEEEENDSDDSEESEKIVEEVEIKAPVVVAPKRRARKATA
jgi:hypothetical protein